MHLSYRFIFFYLLAVCSISLIISCNIQDESEKLFQRLPANETGIDFSNDLSFTQDFNIYRYRNFYNGGGVAIGDVNQDGLPDLFFTSNMGKNRLYLNKGNFEFDDITEKAGVEGQRAWSTGVSMADVNGDGLLDIYVCNSGIVEGDDKRNELYINNGDSTFTEKAAEYGLDSPALSIHASFFDYDRDGDLDMYLVNNSFRAIGSFDQEKNTRNIRDEEGGDKLYRNDGGYFRDVSEEAGIYGSEIGFGLGVSVADVNRDGWQDIYISNDFFERDYLYINKQDGTFDEVLEQQIKSVSAAAMGADIADLNGDGYPEIFVTDMLPDSENRLKQVTTFDSWERYRRYIQDGYYHQFTRNTLQMNNANGTFSEVGRYAGVEATDWSWGANIADLNLDGRRDIFVANGIYRDLTNLDYLQHVSKEETRRKIVSDSTVDFKSLIDIIPSNPISNFAFSNKGKMQFADSSEAWGLDKPGFSNGSAYGDLDNDGDLELVINNLNSRASIYKNNAVENESNRNWLKIDLRGQAPNHYAIGSQLTAYSDNRKWYLEQIPFRGFQSTMDHRLHIGLGETGRLDSLLIQWPDGSFSKRIDIRANQLLKIEQEEEEKINRSISVWADKNSRNKILVDITDEIDLNWQHRESEFNDFSRDRLLFHMRSTEGPPLCAADVNRNGLEDFYVGGAREQEGALLLQNEDGSFKNSEVPLFAEDAASEDTDCVWLDADGNGSMDLYVASGSNEFSASSSALGDRLYLNDGNGNFTRSNLGASSLKYKTAGTVSAADFDNDGDTDLFLGVRLQPFGIGIPVDGYLLENDGSGNFKDVTEEIAPGLIELGMITDSKWGDIDGDGDSDLVIVGEWMPVTIFENREGELVRKDSAETLTSATGWWNAIVLKDLDNDGDLDFVAGNHGLNSRFHGGKENPVEMWINDFDKNGSIEQVIAVNKNGKRYPMALRHDLVDKMPYLEEKYPDFKSFASQTITDIFSQEQLEESIRYRVEELASVVGWNDGKGNFSIERLPMSSQLSPMFGLFVDDLTGDGLSEIIMGGNLYNTKPEVGRYDASYGVVLSIQGDSLVEIPPHKSGFHLDGQVRSIKQINSKQFGKVILVTRNDDSIKAYRVNSHQ